MFLGWNVSPRSLDCFPTPLSPFLTPAGAHPTGSPSPELSYPSSGAAWLCCAWHRGALALPSCPHTLYVHTTFALGYNLCPPSQILFLPLPIRKPSVSCVGFYELNPHPCCGQNSSPAHAALARRLCVPCPSSAQHPTPGNRRGHGKVLPSSPWSGSNTCFYLSPRAPADSEELGKVCLGDLVNPSVREHLAQ